MNDMDKQALLSKLSDIEWDDFEVKDASHGLPRNIWETVSSFANSAGGWIVLGVSHKGKKFEITGVSHGEKIEQDFTNVLRSQNKFNVLITPKCKKYHIAGFTVLAFFIPASPQKPVYFNSLINTFIRSGSGDQRATESEINAMFRDQLFGAMSVKPAERTSRKDINMTTYRRYRDYMARFNPALSYNALQDDEFLEKMQITEGMHLTYGGLLFMGNNVAINKSFPDFRVDLLEIPGRSYAEAATRYTFRLEEQENLWEYYFAIIERLKRHVDMPFKMNELGIAVEDSPQFDALREALVNMLMHTDYFSPAKPRVRIFSNRIEFENPGAFPRTIETFLRKDISIPRNPVLAKLFRSAKLAENAGYGFDKMLAWEKSTQTKVVFENSIDVAQVTFTFFPEDIENEQKNEQEKGIDQVKDFDSESNGASDEQKIHKKEVGDMGANTVDSDDITSLNIRKTNRKRTENEQKTNRKREQIEISIMELLNTNPQITRKEIVEKLGKISEGGIIYYLEKLKKKGKIKREGPDNGGTWIVLDDQNKP